MGLGFSTFAVYASVNNQLHNNNISKLTNWPRNRIVTVCLEKKKKVLKTCTSLQFSDTVEKEDSEERVFEQLPRVLYALFVINNIQNALPLENVAYKKNWNPAKLSKSHAPFKEAFEPFNLSYRRESSERNKHPTVNSWQAEEKYPGCNGSNFQSIVEWKEKKLYPRAMANVLL